MPTTQAKKTRTMKKILQLIILVLPMIAIAQIPVTDVATNASIGIVNSQLTSINIQLKTVNKNLSQLINLMQKNNNYTSKSRDILKEELEAKKKAPSYVIKSTDVSTAMDLKTKILKAYSTSRNSIQQLEYLEKEELQEFSVYTANAILETKNLFKQCNTILKTKAIIHPEERLKKVNNINIKLETILDSIIAFNDRLSRLNAFRKARRTLIHMNKD